MFGIDDFVLGMGLSGGMNLLGGVMGSNAQDEANRRNLQESAENRKFQAETRELQNAYNSSEAVKARDWNMAEAQKARDFVERMSNSAYQRQTADMKAAGINPMLAIMGSGGASSPSGAVAQGAQASGGTSISGSQGKVEASDILPRAMINATSSAFEAMKVKKDIEVMDTQKKVNEALELRTNMDALKSEMDARSAYNEARKKDAEAAKLEAELPGRLNVAPIMPYLDMSGKIVGQAMELGGTSFVLKKLLGGLRR